MKQVFKKSATPLDSYLGAIRVEISEQNKFYGT